MEELKVKISVKVLPSDYTCDGQDISPEIDTPFKLAPFLLGKPQCIKGDLEFR